MNKITRKLNWVSSLVANEKLVALEEALQEYYSMNAHYFTDIDFTADNWIKDEELGYRQIAETAIKSEAICEIGCGNANILKHHPQLAARYTGLDFSETVLQANSSKYPDANFKLFEKANRFPVADEQYDLVFSVFVIEHVTRPAAFLNECTRILKPGGKLIILCPDFLGQGRMTSQRAGFSAGTSKSKLRAMRYIDALVTLFDNRVKIPATCKAYEKKLAEKPLFLINLNPVVFEDPFEPDVDAVYVTSKKEIAGYLQPAFVEMQNSSGLQEYERVKKIIYLQMQKK